MNGFDGGNAFGSFIVKRMGAFSSNDVDGVFSLELVSRVRGVFGGA